MLFAIHADALFDAVVSESVELEQILSSSRIVASDELIELFELKFSHSPTHTQLLQALMAQLGSTGRIKYISHAEATSDTEIYEEAGYFGGKNLAVLHLTDFDEADRSRINRRGTALRELSALNYEGAKLGFDPFEIHIIPHKRKKNPLTVLGRFFKNSSSAIFYDKHINEKSCSFIKCLAEEMDNSASIDIVTSDRCQLSQADIRSLVSVRPGQRLQIEIATASTVELLHDRYCYVDGLYEIHIPRGLDCFGKSPSWSAVNSQVYIYDCHDGINCSISCKPRPGRASSREIPIRSRILRV